MIDIRQSCENSYFVWSMTIQHKPVQYTFSSHWSHMALLLPTRTLVNNNQHQIIPYHPKIGKLARNAVLLQSEMYLHIRSDKLDSCISAHHKYLKTNTHTVTSNHHWIQGRYWKSCNKMTKQHVPTWHGLAQNSCKISALFMLNGAKLLYFGIKICT